MYVAFADTVLYQSVQNLHEKIQDNGKLEV